MKATPAVVGLATLTLQIFFADDVELSVILADPLTRSRSVKNLCRVKVYWVAEPPPITPRGDSMRLLEYKNPIQFSDTFHQDIEQSSTFCNLVFYTLNTSKYTNSLTVYILF